MGETSPKCCLQQHYNFVTLSVMKDHHFSSQKKTNMGKRKKRNLSLHPYFLYSDMQIKA